MTNLHASDPPPYRWCNDQLSSSIATAHLVGAAQCHGLASAKAVQPSIFLNTSPGATMFKISASEKSAITWIIFASKRERILVRIIQVLAFVISTSAYLCGFAFAQNTFPPAGADILLIQQGQKASFDGETLTIHEAGRTLWFSDRPERLYGDIGGTTYVNLWQPGGSFAIDPPNAALIADDGELAGVVLELRTATKVEDGFSYSVRVLSGDVPATVVRPSLFVDPGVEPPNPYGPGGG